MYCRRCGRELEEDALFCPSCGTAVTGAEKRAAAADEATVTTPAAINAADEATVTTPAATNAAVAATPKAAPVAAEPPKVWTVFSIVGKILGIVCLATSIIPFLNYFSLGFGIVGIVMSCLGRKAKTHKTDENCSIGLKLSIAAVVISSVMIIVYMVLLIVVLGNSLSAF